MFMKMRVAEGRLLTVVSCLLLYSFLASGTIARAQSYSASDVDFDDNGIVTFADFIFFAAAFGQPDPTYDVVGEGGTRNGRTNLPVGKRPAGTGLVELRQESPRAYSRRQLPAGRESLRIIRCGG
jgi:hypothetical protein